MHKNTFTRSKDSRWGIIALGWSTEIRKNTLRKTQNTESRYTQHPPPSLGSPALSPHPLYRRVKCVPDFTADPPYWPTPLLGWLLRPEAAPSMSLWTQAAIYPSTGLISWAAPVAPGSRSAPANPGSTWASMNTGSQMGPAPDHCGPRLLPN